MANRYKAWQGSGNAAEVHHESSGSPDVAAWSSGLPSYFPQRVHPQTRSPKANLHPAQFGKHASTPNNNTPANSPYVGKRRGSPSMEPGKAPGTHRADHKHEAPYSAGKDIGHSVGASKKPDYKGKHQKTGPIPHAQGKPFMSGGVGYPVPPPPASSSKSLGSTNNAKSHAKSKANLAKSKNTNPSINLRFRPSKHEGKNKEHLKALVH